MLCLYNKINERAALMDYQTNGDNDKILFHKEKKQKKTTDKRSNVNSLLDNSTNVKGSTAVKSLPEQLEEHQNRQKSIAHKSLENRERLSKQMRNIEIDQRLNDWINEGLVDQAFSTWVAKCCHSLTLEVVNRLAINARNGKSPQRLFSSLLKGNMNLKAKQEFLDYDS